MTIFATIVNLHSAIVIIVVLFLLFTIYDYLLYRIIIFAEGKLTIVAIITIFTISK